MAPRTKSHSSVPRRTLNSAKYFRSLKSLASHAVRVERSRRAHNSFSVWKGNPSFIVLRRSHAKQRLRQKTNISLSLTLRRSPLFFFTMKLLQMHATAYGFPSTGAKNFFGRNSDIADRLVPERKFLCKVFDMSYKNVDIQPHEHDILMGRGGKNNQHSGNEKLRELARVQAKKYSSSTKKGKSILSRILVKQMRELDPPARYVSACAVIHNPALSLYD